MKYLIKAHVRLGDLAMNMGILNAIARLDPESHMEVIATSPTHQLLKECPFIDKLHVRSGSFGADLHMQFSLLCKKWDVVIVTRGASHLQLFYRLARAKHKRSRRFTETPEGLHEMQIQMSMLEGILDGWNDTVDPTIHFDSSRTEKIIDKMGLHGNESILTIAPGASHEKKMWSKENFVALGQNIGKKFDRILVLGDSDEHELCEYVASNFNGINLAGKMDLLDVCALLSLASLHIGNDSGLGHLAASNGTKCLAIGDDSGFRCAPWQQHMILGDAKKISLEQVISFIIDKKICLIE